MSGNTFAAVPAQIVIIVIGGLSLSLVGWVVKMLIKQTVLLDRLVREVFPENKPKLTDQLETIKDNVMEIKIGGSDHLKRIIKETQLQRIENSKERRRIQARETELDDERNRNEFDS